MPPTLKALLEHVIDYAGLFPPAKLSLDESVRNYLGVALDPLLFRGLLAAVENIALHVHEETDGGEAAIARARAVAIHLLASAIGPDAPRAPAL